MNLLNNEMMLSRIPNTNTSEKAIATCRSGTSIAFVLTPERETWL